MSVHAKKKQANNFMQSHSSTKKKNVQPVKNSERQKPKVKKNLS